MQEETAATPFHEDISLVPEKLGRSQHLGLELDARNYFHWRLVLSQHPHHPHWSPWRGLLVVIALFTVVLCGHFFPIGIWCMPV